LLFAVQITDAGFEAGVHINPMQKLSIGLSLLLLYQAAAQEVQLPAPPPPRMNIVALEGEGAINHVRKRQPRNIVVQVRDGNRNPLAGATVHFTLPSQGPSGEFYNGAKTLTATTDQDGRAMARGFRPNSAAGKVEIRVDASRGTETASLVVTQFNMTVSGAKGGSAKWIVLVAVLGAGAAGGAIAATRKGDTAAPAATPIGITAGTGTVGAPR
jgi:hypothetical protein